MPQTRSQAAGKAIQIYDMETGQMKPYVALPVTRSTTEQGASQPAPGTGTGQAQQKPKAAKDNAPARPRSLANPAIADQTLYSYSIFSHRPKDEQMSISDQMGLEKKEDKGKGLEVRPRKRAGACMDADEVIEPPRKKQALDVNFGDHSLFLHCVQHDYSKETEKMLGDFKERWYPSECNAHHHGSTHPQSQKEIKYLTKAHDVVNDVKTRVARGEFGPVDLSNNPVRDTQQAWRDATPPTTQDDWQELNPGLFPGLFADIAQPANEGPLAAPSTGDEDKGNEKKLRIILRTKTNKGKQAAKKGKGSKASKGAALGVKGSKVTKKK